MRLAFEQMVESFLPFHVAAEQAPHRIVRGTSTYSLEYRNVTSETGLDRIVILIRDVTAQLEAEKVEQSTKEFYRLLTSLLQDPNGFRQSIEEITALMESARSTSNILECKQALHTIKGSCSVVGFRRVADFVHELETSIAEYTRLPTETELAELDTLWRNLLLSVSDFLPSDTTGRIQLESVEYQDLINLLEIHAPHQEMLAYVQRWPHERVTKQLERLQQHVYRLAKRLDKAIDVRIDDGGVRVEPERLKAFWPTLVHIVRNAVDHGCEPQSERERQGKPPRCLMELSSRQSATQFEISISDDGRGIDWESIRQKAIRLGLANQSQHDLVEALFTDGLSTRDEATDISGRGIGLHAVRTACADAGGYLHVESTLGKGTTFLFRFRSYRPHLPTPRCVTTKLRQKATAKARKRSSNLSRQKTS